MMRHQHYELNVLPKGRTPAVEYPHKGETWIEGRYNSWYEIHLHNHTQQRVMAIVTVDGVGVVDGEPGSYTSPGFILEAHQHLVIPGWVKSASEAAKFVFTDSSKSYADQSGQGSNPGIIGSAWFPEMQVPVWQHHTVVTKGFPNTLRGAVHQDWYKGVMNQNSVIGSGISARVDSYTSSVSSTMGTGWGDSADFSTQKVEFKRAKHQPDALLCLRYDSAQALQRMGIRLRNREDRYTQAFPGNSDGYCKPPPLWTNQKAFK